MRRLLNVYDFDKTILNTDSTEKFYFYCLKRYPKILKHLPATAAAFFKYIIGKTDKTAFKQVMYRFLREVPDIDAAVEDFWDKNIHRVFDWYKRDHKDGDVVISASPEFLLEPVCKRLGIKNLLASRVDKKKGEYTGTNCWGQEKVNRFREKFGDAKIDVFCSDSLSDTPLAMLSDKRYIVKPDGKLVDWDSYKPPLLKRILKNIFSRQFGMYAAIGVVNVAVCVVFAHLFSKVFGANIGFIIGYIISLCGAYLLNTKYNFKMPLSFARFLGFCFSYIPNFVVQNACVIILYNGLHVNHIITYILSAMISVPLTFAVINLVFGCK